MKFKNLKNEENLLLYGDLTGKTFDSDITLKRNVISSLEGFPKIINGNLNCKNNPDLKNIKSQIIKNQIKAELYFTDDGNFSFNEIKQEFEKYGKKLSDDLIKNNNLILKQNKLI